MKMVVEISTNKYMALKALSEGGVNLSSEQKAILEGTPLKSLLEEIRTDLVKKTWDDYYMPVKTLSDDDIAEVMNKYVQKCEEGEP